MTMVETRLITGGVDTHLDAHVAAALDPLGGVLGVESFEATPAGYRKLFEWLANFGPVTRVGVEGASAYGAGLARLLRSEGVEVIEVDRPNRQTRRLVGKSDPVDAVEAARAAQSGRASGIAKTADGTVEAIRVLMVAKRSARDQRIATLNQIRHLVFTAPDELRERFRHASRAVLAREVAAVRPRPESDVVVYATKTALRSLGRRVLALEDEMAELHTLLGELIAVTAPELLDIGGVGVDVAAILLAAVGDNGGRIRSEAAFAQLCGVAPLPASSGKVNRHRLNRGGNRQANHALWRIVMTRMGNDPRTRAYVARRLDEGRSKPEIIRVLKRYVAREVFRSLPKR